MDGHVFSQNYIVSDEYPVYIHYSLYSV